jgi:phage head maturation protease
MPFKKISADEARAKRKDHVRDTDRGPAITKAAKAPASWDGDTRSARFIMSTQGVDRYGDIIVTAGIDTTEFERNPVGLLFHNSRTWPVANWDNLEKQLKGRPPRLEGDFILLPADGPGEIGERIAETEWMIANGGIRACSIGFVPDWDEVEVITDDDGYWKGFRFNKTELVECSICSIPANPGALAKSAEGDPRLAKELIEDILDNWARSPEGLLLPRSEFEKAYRLTVEKIDADRVEQIATTEAIEDAAVEEMAQAGVVEGNVEEKAGADDPDPQDPPSPQTKEVQVGAFVAPLKLDTTEAEVSLGRVGGLIDSLSERLAKIFGMTKSTAGRVEPVMEKEPPPAPPSPEAIAVAKSRAAETLTRLQAKGF